MESGMLVTRKCKIIRCSYRLPVGTDTLQYDLGQSYVNSETGSHLQPDPRRLLVGGLQKPFNKAAEPLLWPVFGGFGPRCASLCEDMEKVLRCRLMEPFRIVDFKLLNVFRFLLAEVQCFGLVEDRLGRGYLLLGPV